MGRKGFYVDMTACVGCRTCQIACKDKNNLKVGTLFRQVRTFETGAYPHPGVYHFSGTCNHCTNPKCVEGCPTGAMYIDTDLTVQHDDSKCIGCKYCVWNCPYGNPKFIPELGVVHKCDMCKDLRKQGLNPACADACYMRAIEWGDLDELKAKHPTATSDLPILPKSTITTPSMIVNPRVAALQKGFQQKEV